MEISLRDLYILLECGKHSLRFLNSSVMFTREDISDVVNRVINQLDNVKITIKE